MQRMHPMTRIAQVITYPFFLKQTVYPALCLPTLNLSLVCFQHVPLYVIKFIRGFITTPERSRAGGPADREVSCNRRRIRNSFAQSFCVFFKWATCSFVIHRGHECKTGTAAGSLPGVVSFVSPGDGRRALWR